MAGEHEQAAVPPHRVELGRPQVEHLRAATRSLTPIGGRGRYAYCSQSSRLQCGGSSAIVPRSASRAGTACRRPSASSRSRARARRRAAACRQLASHSADAVALGLDADAVERRERALEVRALAFRAGSTGLRWRRSGGRPRDRPRGSARPSAGSGRPSGPGRRTSPAGEVVEQVEDARDADERPVRLMRHDRRRCGVAAALREDRRLGVDVERQAGERCAAPSQLTPSARSDSSS